MNLPDSFYIALCMTILLVGAVYWVWTQIQYVQRKVNVLENIVYELKTLCSRPPDGGPIAPTHYPPAPPSVLGEDEDLLHETLATEVGSSGPYATVEEVQDWSSTSNKREIAQMKEEYEVQEAQKVQDLQDVQEVQEVQEAQEVAPDFSEPVFDMGHYVVQSESQEKEATVSDELQPGGVGSGVTAPSIQSSLEGMTTKELRRLAQQKGISGANELKKKDLIEAIRAVPIESFLE